MDLYRCLGVPHRVGAAASDVPDDDRPRPLSVETRAVETTDESGLLAVSHHIAL